MGREYPCKRISLVCVGGARGVRTALGLRPLAVVACAFPVHTAQTPGCSAGQLSKAGPGLCAFPRTKPLRFRASGTPRRNSPRWACGFCSLPSSEQLRQPGPWGARSPGVRYVLSPPRPSRLVSRVHSHGAISGVPCVSSGELISDRDPPGGCQPPRIPGRLGQQLEPAHSLVEDAVSGAEIASCLPALAVACLPLCPAAG